MTTTLEIQRRLLALGYRPGPLDGIPGRATAAAIRAYQARNGVDPDGIAGPRTLAALFADAPGESRSPPLPWMEEARRHLGLKEVAGGRHNATIAKWLARLKAGWSDDETPWCGTFVGWCIAATLAEEPMPANPFGARNWLRFGLRCEPQLGAVLVFSRPGSAWSGHVGFYAGETHDGFHVLGGNQGNAVSIASLARARLLGARWPATAGAASGTRIRGASAPITSTDEA